MSAQPEMTPAPAQAEPQPIAHRVNFRNGGAPTNWWDGADSVGAQAWVGYGREDAYIEYAYAAAQDAAPAPADQDQRDAVAFYTRNPGAAVFDLSARLARARDQARSATTEGRGPKDAEPGPQDAPKAATAATQGAAK
jgi:hypothetical protein